MPAVPAERLRNRTRRAVSTSIAPFNVSFSTQNGRQMSRDAKAQAVYRARREAYVEQVYMSLLRSIASSPTAPTLAPIPL